MDTPPERPQKSPSPAPTPQMVADARSFVDSTLAMEQHAAWKDFRQHQLARADYLSTTVLEQVDLCDTRSVVHLLAAYREAARPLRDLEHRLQTALALLERAGQLADPKHLARYQAGKAARASAPDKRKPDIPPDTAFNPFGTDPSLKDLQKHEEVDPKSI